mgnify:CR=1 FL=1|tara:strand:+ start:1166 stop:1405 length:240 start_codon:yes stop_codon:yes gene_type:complete
MKENLNFKRVRTEIKTSLEVLAKDLSTATDNEEWETVLLASMGIVKLLEITNPNLFGKVRLMLDGSDAQTTIENRDMFL